MTLPKPIAVYAIRNSEGLWFKRATNASWPRKTWVEDFTSASVWANPAPAKQIIGNYVRHSGLEAMPDLVKITTTEVEVVDNKKEVAKRALKDVRKKLSEAQHRHLHRPDSWSEPYLNRLRRTAETLEKTVNGE